MIQGENNLSGEVVKSISLTNGVISGTDIDVMWGPMNEQFDKDMPVDGYINYVIVRKHPTLGDYVEMRTIFVDKKKREAGVGRKLFEALEVIAHQAKIRRIVVKVTCMENDANAFCRFLPAMGYTKLPASDYDFDWEKYL